eukprot:8370118-Lingulodinium_polyedra.AAC.1
MRISEFLWSTERPPRAVILENVPGLLARVGVGGAPIDFIMDNKRYGLKRLRSRYWIVQPIVLSSAMMGLPMNRKRVFIILIRRDVAADGVATGVLANSQIMHDNPIKCVGGIEQLMSPHIDSDSSLAPKKAAKTEMTKKSIMQSDEVRKRLNLPRRSTVAGRPVTENPRQYGASNLSKREQDLLDVAVLRSKQLRGDGSISKDLVVDLSQTAPGSVGIGIASALKCRSFRCGFQNWFSGYLARPPRTRRALPSS